MNCCKQTSTGCIERGLCAIAWMVLCLSIGLGGSSVAGAVEPASPTDLKPDVMAVIRAKCVKCHGPIKHEAGLDLSTPRGIARGGESGAAVLAGKLSDSILWQRVDADEMPPDEPLEAEDRALVKRWIEQGARGLPSPQEAAQPGPDHWAFRTPVRPALPEVRDASRVRTDVDRFILAALEARGLTLSAESDRATLVRRVSFDVTGLPPTPDETAAFVSDPAPDAYERMVDRYLASPRYGERWGQHWLDAAGYADSNGYFNADSDRPLAWRYRDWVIRSINADKPFDRFVREQLAGDELAGYVPDGDVTPDMAELLVATHYLRNAPDGTGESDGNPDEVRVDRYTVLEGTVQIVASSLLGLTMQCARCHDHKFEPLHQAEYYQLQAILWPAYNPAKWAKPADRIVTVGTKSERDEHARRVKEVDERIASLRKELDAARDRTMQDWLGVKLAGVDESVRKALREAIERPVKKRSAEQRSLVEKHKSIAAPSEDDLAGFSTGFAAERKTLTDQIAAAEKDRPRELDRLSVLTDLTSQPDAHHVLVRGDYAALGPEVQPGVPGVIAAAGGAYRNTGPGTGAHGTGRRTALAQWITSPDNPLFARVAVNRIWQEHFGRGIVSSTDNFGYTGADPSHPELLDYLTTEFVRGGWSMKALHRLILRSAVYRQASDVSDAARERDEDNILLSRFPLRRLDAESVRDAMLAAAGELDLSAGGAYVPSERQPDGDVVVDEKLPGAHRRSVYLQRRRSQVVSMLDVFDMPRVVNNCTRRTSSTIPLQSLSLLNSEFAMTRAAGMAARLAKEAGSDTVERIDHAFRIATSRGPTPDELAASEQFLAKQRTHYADQPDADQRVWRDYCQMLLAGSAFLYVE